MLFCGSLTLQNLPLIESEVGPLQRRLTVYGVDWLVCAESYSERDVLGHWMLQINRRSLSVELGRCNEPYCSSLGRGALTLVRLQRTTYHLTLPGTYSEASHTPPDNEPGLLLPGKLVSVLQTPTHSWIGQVLGVSLAVRWQQNGLAVDQTVTLEHYLDE